MPSQAWSVWICASCRRRVPEQFVECRCGALRAQALGVITPQDEAGGGASLVPKLLMALLFGGAVAGSWLWYQRAPALVIPRAEQAAGSQVPPEHMQAPTERAQAVPMAAPPPLADNYPAPPPRQAETGGVSEGLLWPSPPPPVRVGENASPPPTTYMSEPDRARQAGMDRLRAEFAALRGNAISLVAMAKRYEAGRCTNRLDEGCEQLLVQIGNAALNVGAAIERTEEIARTSWLDPGVVRDMREQYGLGAAIWDEIERITREYRR